MKKSLAYKLGIVLIIPPVISVLIFCLYLVIGGSSVLEIDHLGTALVGKFYNTGSGNNAPVYLGLMAIAGAILRRDGDKKE